MILGILKSIIIKIKNGKNLKMGIYKNISFSSEIKAKNAYIKIGKGLLLNRFVSIGAVNNGKIVIGNNVSFNRNSICASHEFISIGDKSSIGPNCCIYDHDHKFGKNGKEPGFKTGTVIIEENVWIGAGSIILRGTHIGKNSVIGAGCIIKGEIPPNSLVKQNRTVEVEKLR